MIKQDIHYIFYVIANINQIYNIITVFMVFRPQTNIKSQLIGQNKFYLAQKIYFSYFKQRNDNKSYKKIILLKSPFLVGLIWSIQLTIIVKIEFMSGIWLHQKRIDILIQEKPVLDENRNRIITFDKQLAQKIHISDNFGYLKELGYELTGEIGRGGYGVAYKAKSIENPSKQYAIKINYDVVARSTIYLQVAFFQLFRKKNNLPKIIDFFFHQNTPHIVLQFFQHQQFIEIFEQTRSLKQVKHYMIELLKGLSNLKKMGIYHRDIKPYNFLYNKNNKNGIIIDFGLAEIDEDYVKDVVQKKYINYKKKIPKKQRQSNSEFWNKRQQYYLYRKLIKANKDHGLAKIGTQSYVPLETLLGSQDQGHQCQIWSAGVILLQFLAQKLHFFGQVKLSNVEQSSQLKFISFFVMELTQIFGTKAVQDQIRKNGWSVIFPKGIMQKGDLRKMMRLKSQNQSQNEEAYDLLMKMIALKPSERIAVEDAIWHPFFDQVRQEHYQKQSEQSWYKKQYERRHANKQSQSSSSSDAVNEVGKSMSVNQAESQFSKSMSKAKKGDDESSSQDNDSSYLEKYKEEKKLQRGKLNNFQHEKQENKEDQSKKKSDSQQQDQSVKKSPKHRIHNQTENDKEDAKEQQKKNDNIDTTNIMQTIRKYVAQKQILKAKGNLQQRIVINTQYEPPIPKKTKVQKKIISKPKQKKQTQNKKAQATKKQEKPQQNLGINLALEQILKKQQQRLQKQKNSSTQYKKIQPRKAVKKTKKEQSSQSSYSDDQSS